MDLLVLLQVAFADKALPAHVALVWLLTRVDPLVLSQSGSSCKTLSTLCTSMGFVAEHNSSMCLLVLLQVGGCSKAFATLTAGIWLLACMDLLMLFQMPSADKALPTLGALVRFVL